MVNDTTTLNGALSELGETLATNITAKGVSASASDGLTTLANKVLQISGDTPTPSTVLFEDDCSSDRSNEYTNGSLQSSSYTNYLSMDYNSNGYYTIQATNNEGNHYAKWITALNGEDDLKLSCEVSTNTLSNTNRFGLVVGTSDYKSLHFQIVNNQMEGATFKNNSYSSIGAQTISSLATNTWYKMEYTVQGTSYTFKLADMSDNVLYTKTDTFPSDIITDSSTKQYGLYYLNYGSSYQKMFRNIKAESLGGGSDCTQYQTQINNAIEYINGSGS